MIFYWLIMHGNYTIIINYIRLRMGQRPKTPAKTWALCIEVAGRAHSEGSLSQIRSFIIFKSHSDKQVIIIVFIFQRERERLCDPRRCVLIINQVAEAMDLEVAGRHAMLFDDDGMAAFVNSAEALVEWNSLFIDRYDVRHLLSAPLPPRLKRRPPPPEPDLDHQRYLDLPSSSADDEQQQGNLIRNSSILFTFQFLPFLIVDFPQI